MRHIEHVLFDYYFYVLHTTVSTSHQAEADVQEMAVFGGVNPASDLNTVAIWRTA